MSALRLPAFAKDLAQARREGMTLRDPTVSVWLHWRSRPRLGYGVVVRDQDDPAELDWSFLVGLEVLLFARGDAKDRVRAAARAIRAARPSRLLIIDCEDPKIVVIVRGTDA
jgi:hypothetical protein